MSKQKRRRSDRSPGTGVAHRAGRRWVLVRRVVGAGWLLLPADERLGTRRPNAVGGAALRPAAVSAA
jgi:hypothetical protein